MKIAVWHNLPSGGGRRALGCHLDGLMARGHHVEVWSPVDREAWFRPPSCHAHHVVPLRQPLLPKPAGSLRQSLWLRREVSGTIGAFHEHCRACAAEMARGGFDLVFANSPLSPLAHYAPVPAVLYLQEPTRALFEARPDLPWKALPPPRGRIPSPGYVKWFAEDLLEVDAHRKLLSEEVGNARRFGRILVNSFFSRESLWRAYGRDSTVCYLGVDAGHFRPTGAARASFVFGLGEIRPHKGIDRVLRGLGSVAAARRPELVWVGNASDPDYRQGLEELAGRLGVTCHFKYRATDEELLGLLNGALCMVYAPRLEPFGFAALEAMACETPVVAIREGGVRETVEDGVSGLLVDGDDPAAFGAAVDALVGDPARCRALGRAARDIVVRKWTWTAALDRLEAALRAQVKKEVE